MDSFGSMVQRVPFPVMWNGFRSDLATLRQHEWDINVSTLVAVDRDAYEIRVFLKSRKQQMEGYICATLDRAYMYASNPNEMLKYMHFDISEMAPKIQFRVIPMRDMRIFENSSIATTGIMQMTFYGHETAKNSDGRGNFNMSDLIRFEEVGDEGLLLEKAEVGDLLSAIIKRQEPKQDEIRERRRIDAEKGKLWTPEKKLLLLSS